MRPRARASRTRRSTLLYNRERHSIFDTGRPGHTDEAQCRPSDARATGAWQSAEDFRAEEPRELGRCLHVDCFLDGRDAVQCGLYLLQWTCSRVYVRLHG